MLSELIADKVQKTCPLKVKATTGWQKWTVAQAMLEATLKISSTPTYKGGSLGHKPL